MARYIRKTHDEYHVQGNYGGVAGWETVSIEETYAEGKQMLKDYNENEPQYPHRLIKRRVRNDERRAE